MPLHHLRRIGIPSAVRIGFFLSWALGVLVGLGYVLLYLFTSRFHSRAFEEGLGELGAGSGTPWPFVLLGGFLLSIACAAIGAVAWGCVALLYNFLAGVIGGLEVELEAREAEDRS